MNNNTEKRPGEGYLRIRATTARGAIPLQNAIVNIRGSQQENSGIIGSYVTDANGLTPLITLSAPPRANSESPGMANPFSTYNVEVFLDGYYSQYYYNVPVFEGIAAMQTAELTALPENGIPDRFTIDSNRYFENENPNL